MALFAAHPQLLAPVLQIIHRVIATFSIQPAGLKSTEADTGAGVAIGIDRLVMIAAGAKSLEEVIAFLLGTL